MRVDGAVDIASVATWIPEEFELPPDYDGLGVPDFGLPQLRVKSLPVSRELAAPEMATLAARACLAEGGWEAARLNVLFHSHLYHQGHDFWSAAHYIARELGTPPHATPVTIQQNCNGAMFALELAATRFLADPEAEAVLLTTADRFAPPGWNRWEHPGVGLPYGFGDGATAALVRRAGDTPTTLALLSVVQTTDPEFEVIFRGEPDFTPAPMWNKAVFFDGNNLPYMEDLDFALKMRKWARISLSRALDDAGIKPDDKRIRYVLLPRADTAGIGLNYGTVFDCLAHAEVVAFGEHTGHIGAGDQLANIVEMRDRGMLRCGEIAVLVGGGGGTTWSTVLVQAGPGWQR
ncbi:ketoacyl-ACP synthase III family protein [Streptomyces monticola]|uniref:Ketoacyl-ACP synthase III family protein n=1 Tax=Streptomyces monticola TaxID=2666263 RepID=A0ABW2JGU0_9ACTN